MYHKCKVSLENADCKITFNLELVFCDTDLLCKKEIENIFFFEINTEIKKIWYGPISLLLLVTVGVVP